MYILKDLKNSIKKIFFTSNQEQQRHLEVRPHIEHDRRCYLHHCFQNVHSIGDPWHVNVFRFLFAKTIVCSNTKLRYYVQLTHFSSPLLIAVTPMPPSFPTDISLSAIVDTILGRCSRLYCALLGSEAAALRHGGHRGYGKKQFVVFLFLQPVYISNFTYSSTSSQTINEASVPPTVTTVRSPYKNLALANVPE